MLTSDRLLKAASGSSCDPVALDSPIAQTVRLATHSSPTRATGRRWSLLFARIVAVVLGIVVPVLVLEVLLRQFGAVAPGEYQTVGLNAASDLFGRQNVPNRAGWKRSSEFNVYVRVNSKGLRGPEIPYDKAPTAYRVLVL